MRLGERRQKVIRIISVLNAYYVDNAYCVRIKGVLAPQETIKSAPIAQLDREHRSIANGQSFSGWRFHKFILPEGGAASIAYK